MFLKRRLSQMIGITTTVLSAVIVIGGVAAYANGSSGSPRSGAAGVGAAECLRSPPISWRLWGCS